MIRPVTGQEIKSAVFQFNPDKAQGPDRFNVHFYQKNWSNVGKKNTAVIKDFFQNEKLLRELNHTSATLVPISTVASSLSDYRPKSCCNLIYKFISKVISNRLQQVIGELVSSNQCAFLAGRNISYCTLLAYEMIRNFKKKNWHQSLPKGRFAEGI